VDVELVSESGYMPTSFAYSDYSLEYIIRTTLRVVKTQHLETCQIGYRYLSQLFATGENVVLKRRLLRGPRARGSQLST
jgi:hypothetical protein